MKKDIPPVAILDYSEIFAEFGVPETRPLENFRGSGGCQFSPNCDRFGTLMCEPTEKCLAKIPQIAEKDLESSTRMHTGNNRGRLH